MTARAVAHLAVLRVVVPNRRSLSVTFRLHHHLSGLSSDLIGKTELLGRHCDISILCSYRITDTTIIFALFACFYFLVRQVLFLLQDFGHNLIDLINSALFGSFLTPAGLSTLSLETGGFCIGTRHLPLLQLFQSGLFEMSQEPHDSSIGIDARVLDQSVYFNIFLCNKCLLIVLSPFLVFIGILPWLQKVDLIFRE